MAKTPPIDPMNYNSGATVVDYGDLRVARGLSRRSPFLDCKHLSMVYDINERRVYCEKCESDVEPYDAFLALVQNHNKAVKRAKSLMDEAREAKAATLHRIAARVLEKIWRGKTLPCCPHCDRGITPADMEKPSRVGKVFEMKRREKDAEKAKGLERKDD